jgi:hypothetical protein
MGTTAIPYSRGERKHAYFIIHEDIKVEKKLTFLQRLKFWSNKQQTDFKRRYCIFNKAGDKYNLVDEIKKANVFRFDKACELAKKIGDENIKVIMVKKTDNGYILV